MEKKRILTEFGKRVRKRLIDKNMSQRELASVIGTSETYLCKMMYGERSIKKYKVRIEKALGIEETA